MKTQEELNQSGEIHGSEFDRRKRPTIAELEAILEKGDAKIDIAPNGEVLERAYSFTERLQHLLNEFSKENNSNTPDFVLAAFMENCLTAFNLATHRREQFYGRSVNTKDSGNG